MTHAARSASARTFPGDPNAYGQALVEFGLVIPILIVLFVAVADFGRIFATGLQVEAAARDAAEVVANRYLAAPPAALNQPVTAPAPGYYSALHAAAERTVCQELKALPNANYDAATSTCSGMPLVLVCIHDSADTSADCASDPNGMAVPPECDQMTPPPTSDQAGTQQRWVEVRVCYHFTSLLQLPLFSLGDYWLQRTRTFPIACYYALGPAECG